MIDHMVWFIVKVFVSSAILAAAIYRFPSHTAEIITFLAVLVALFRDRIENFYFRPKLVLRLSDPPTHFAEVELRNLKTGEYIETHASMGIIIENIGVGKAKNVMLYFFGIESTVVSNFTRYQSLPMVRSWSNEGAIKSLPPKTPIRFDIGYLRSTLKHRFHFNLIATPTALSPITCAPETLTKFVFEVKAICDNANVASSTIEIDFQGSYTGGLKLSLKQ